MILLNRFSETMPIATLGSSFWASAGSYKLQFDSASLSIPSSPNPKFQVQEARRP